MCNILSSNIQNFFFLDFFFFKYFNDFILFCFYFQKWYLTRNGIWLVKSFLDTRYLIRNPTKVSTTFLQLRISQGFLPLFLRVSMKPKPAFISKIWIYIYYGYGTPLFTHIWMFSLFAVGCILKVSKFRKQILKFSFEPKYKNIFVRILVQMKTFYFLLPFSSWKPENTQKLTKSGAPSFRISIFFYPYFTLIAKMNVEPKRIRKII